MTLRRLLYGDVVATRIDAEGALRLFRRGRVFLRQSIYHPQGEWLEVELRPTGDAIVTLGSGEELPEPREAATKSLRALDPRGDRNLAPLAADLEARRR